MNEVLHDGAFENLQPGYLVLRPEYHIGDDQLVDRCQPVSSAVSTPENGENVGCTQGPVPLARSLVF